MASGEPPGEEYQCPDCNYKTKNKETLAFHIRISHPSSQPAAGAEGDAPGLADAPQEVSKQQLEGSDDLHVGAFEGMNDAALALSPQHIEGMSQDDKDSGRIPAAPPSAAGPMAGGEDPCPWVMPNGDQESADGPGEGTASAPAHVDARDNARECLCILCVCGVFMAVFAGWIIWLVVPVDWMVRGRFEVTKGWTQTQCTITQQNCTRACSCCYEGQCDAFTHELLSDDCHVLSNSTFARNAQGRIVTGTFGPSEVTSHVLKAPCAGCSGKRRGGVEGNDDDGYGYDDYDGYGYVDDDDGYGRGDDAGGFRRGGVQADDPCKGCSKGFFLELSVRVGDSEQLAQVEQTCYQSDKFGNGMHGAICKDRAMFTSGAECSSASAKTQECEPQNLNRAGRGVTCWVDPNGSGTVRLYSSEGVGEPWKPFIAWIVVTCGFAPVVCFCLWWETCGGGSFFRSRGLVLS